MRRATYDAGALIAAERNSLAMWRVHRRLLERGLRPSVSAAVVAQVWRGGPQPLLSRLLDGCEILPLTTAVARAAGAALAASGSSDVVDAAVVVGAKAERRAIVTSDPGDLYRLAQSIGFDAVITVV
ncbi:MAG: hypothetical protein WD993_05495 [Thermoleophilaceae bacterium]